MDQERLQKLWKRLGFVLLVLSIIIVAGPQILVLLGLR